MQRVSFAAVMCLVTLPALAQDPVQLDPKHYKVEFVNAKVRVLHINLGSRESTPMHSEPPSVLVWLTDGTLKCTAAGGKTEEVHGMAKHAAWVPAMQRACENLGDQPVEFYQISLKSGPPFPE
jgi:beta-alanine degradation protein BauB